MAKQFVVFIKGRNGLAFPTTDSSDVEANFRREIRNGVEYGIVPPGEKDKVVGWFRLDEVQGMILAESQPAEHSQIAVPHLTPMQGMRH